MANGDSIVYVYGAGGSKLQKLVYESSSLTASTHYAGAYVYKDDLLNFMQSAEGRISKTTSGFVYEYHLKDHIGNVRVAFIDNNGTPKVIQESDYYPFGLRFGEQRIGNDNKYLFSGKEQQDDVVAGVSLDWYDYGAMMYSVELGRWHAVDPANQFFSPYVGIGNNPINGYDPDGMIYQEMAKGGGGNSGGSSSSSGSKKKRKGIGAIFQEKLNDVKEGLGNFTGWIGDELVPGFDVTNSNSEISRFGNWMWNTGFPALDPTYPQIDRFGDYEYDYPSAFYNLLCIQHWIVPVLIENIKDKCNKDDDWDDGTNDDCDQIIIKGGYGYTGNADDIDPESVVFFNNAVSFDMDKQLIHTCVSSIMEYLSIALGDPHTQGYYDIDYMVTYSVYGGTYVEQGVTGDNINGFVNRHFKTAKFTSFVDAIINGVPVMTNYLVDKDKNLTHNVLVVGYLMGTDDLIILNPQTTFLEVVPANILNCNYAIPIIKTKSNE